MLCISQNWHVLLKSSIIKAQYTEDVAKNIVLSGWIYSRLLWLHTTLPVTLIHIFIFFSKERDIRMPWIFQWICSQIIWQIYFHNCIDLCRSNPYPYLVEGSTRSALRPETGSSAFLSTVKRSRNWWFLGLGTFLRESLTSTYLVAPLM